MPPLPRSLRRVALAVAALPALLVLVGALWSAPAGSQQAAPGVRQPTAGPADPEKAEKIEKLDVLGDLLLDEPLYDGDFADPYMLRTDTDYYAFATNTTSAHIPVLRMSEDPSSTVAEYLGDALPQLPSWTTENYQWAPSVWQNPGGTYVMYYASRLTSAGKQCISVATATDPAGPYTDSSSAPFICPLDEGGAIDPSVFVADDGTPWLVWKADGNCCQLPTAIYSQQLAADGLSTAGPPHRLITADQSWEGGVVEGPSLVQDGSTFYLFYSANNWDSADYAIGVATCSSITGPCTKPDDGPWEASAEHSQGPGGEEFFTVPGSTRLGMVRHGWLPGQADTLGGQRRLYLDVVDFDTSGLPRRVGAQETEEALLVRYVLPAIAVLALAAGVAVLVVRRRRQGRGGPPAGPEGPTAGRPGDEGAQARVSATGR